MPLPVDPNESIARRAYTALADQFSALAPTKAENAYIEQPAMRAALGDVRGLDVLDAGCGPGILLAYLIGARELGRQPASTSPRACSSSRASGRRRRG